MPFVTASPDRRPRRAARLTAGALAAGAALAVAPSMASASSTCVFDATTGQVDVQMTSASTILQSAGEEFGPTQNSSLLLDGQFCFTANKKLRASFAIIKKIKIKSASPAGTDTVIVDESNGRLDNPFAPRPQIIALTGAGGDTIMVNGSPFSDTYTANGGLGARIHLDAGVPADDIVSSGVGRIVLAGNGGGDTLSAAGYGAFPNRFGTTVRTEIFGGDGNDVIVGGISGNDLLDGGLGGDFMSSSNGKGGDRAIGGDGPGDSISKDKGDTASGFEFDSSGVGTVKLASKVVAATAGKASAMTMSWTHPQSWTHLRTISLKLSTQGKYVGTITIAPGTKAVTADGAVKLVKSATTLKHKGKTVTAKLALMPGAALAGRTLQLDAAAVDVDGKQQSETGIGEIRVAK